MPFDSMELLSKYLSTSIDGRTWRRYTRLRHFGRGSLTKLNADPARSYDSSPFDRPFRAQRYFERLDCERAMKVHLLAKISAGHISIRAFDDDLGKSEEVDAHALSSAVIDFEGNIISLGSRHLSNVCVTTKLAPEIAGNMSDDRQRRLAEEQLRRWFADRLDRGEKPLSQPRTYELAKQELHSRYISEGLFGRIWDELRHPHPLKHNGRPPRDER